MSWSARCSRIDPVAAGDGSSRYVMSAQLPLRRFAFASGRAAIPSAVLAAFVALAQTAAAQEACWPPDALRRRPGEEKIVQGTPKALVAPPAIPEARTGQSPYPRWNGALRRVDLPGQEKVVALTFDLCEQPHEVAGYQGDVIDTLRDRNIPATFFAGGKWLLTHPERAEQLMADPLFEIGDHTWDHANLRLVSGAELADEIENPQAAYLKTRETLSRKQCLDRTGEAQAVTRAPARMTLFRFPFGACNAAALRAVEDAGLRAVQWEVATADPVKSQTADRIVHAAVNGARSGSIIIFHANGRGWRTGEALPAVIDGLQKRGFTFDTVSGLLNRPGAKPIVASTCYDVKPGDSDRYDAIAKTLMERQNALVEKLRANAKQTAAPASGKDEPSQEQ
jgi:peptidoglycan-N-acetylglucosamine deacetylase